MNDVRTALRDLADEGRPVDLGAAALRGLRRRRRRNAALGAAAVAVLVAVAALPWSGLRRPAPPPAAPAAGQHVAAAYADADGAWWVLDPATGRHRRTAADVLAVSPTLDRVAVRPPERERTLLAVEATALTGPATVLVRLPAEPRSAQWSPDGSRLVVALEPGPVGDEFVDPGFTDVAVVDAVTGAVDRFGLGLGELRRALRVWWGDDGTLLAAVATVDAVEVPREFEVYSAEGSLRRRDPAPRGQSCSGRLSAAAVPPVLAGRPLACTRGATEITLWTTGEGGPAVAGRLPVEPGQTVAPVGWSDPDTVAVLRETPAGVSLHSADLRTGRLGPAAPGLPADATEVVVGPADGLSAAAADLAF
ncbi:hypothetical protein [Spirilliplanes yamanashiensis]|uniref:Uncharacterized protein n=1 Tax=Spirilliplanes yamanashiensis TaxID=42233 RepID=A0A8J4DK85_9ACTN|nr:hypothetical protein [Spirilliplanes yamanashiensis]MDP9815541.1 hypothetical protein [Spirilliplanes yamanashiensis]GIJ03795.1 hypothetical protein Sya03_31470 [Spirilliplanes yamanashiensis]